MRHLWQVFPEAVNSSALQSGFMQYILGSGEPSCRCPQRLQNLESISISLSQYVHRFEALVGTLRPSEASDILSSLKQR